MLEFFGSEMRPPSSAQLLMTNSFTRTQRQFLFRGQKLARVPDDDAVCCFMQLLSQNQSVGQQITIDRLEKGLTRKTTRSWWIDLDTMKELENCLKKLDRGVSRKHRNWVKHQKAELSKLELRIN